MSQGALRHIEWRVDDPANEWADVAIYVDGVSFVDLVKQYEETRALLPNRRLWVVPRGACHAALASFPW